MRKLNLLLCAGALAACASSKSAERPQEGWNEHEPTETRSVEQVAPSEPALEPASAEASSTRRAEDAEDAREARGAAANARAKATDERAEVPEVGVDTREAAPQKAADNTDINERDSDGRTLTPLDQGGSKGDREITQQIRQAVVGNDSLSFTAKNVKIITIDGKVTLRGPVKSQQERATIGAAAKQVAGTRVDNQLEIAE